MTDASDFHCAVRIKYNHRGEGRLTINGLDLSYFATDDPIVIGSIDQDQQAVKVTFSVWASELDVSWPEQPDPCPSCGLTLHDNSCASCAAFNAVHDAEWRKGGKVK